MSGRHADFLELADWRRRVAEMYAEVRRLAATEPAAALEHWRAARERLYREHPQSPLPAAARATFQARHFPYDPALRFEVPLLPDPAAAPPIAIPTSDGGAMAFRHIGWVEIPFPAGRRRLGLAWL